MLAPKIQKLLNQREFISVATCDLTGQPNAVPKFFLKAEDRFIYLVDYTIGRTWENLKINPQVSLSFSELEMLHGYRINGRVEILEKGPGFESLLSEVKEKTTALTVERVLTGVQQRKTHQHFEVGIPEKFVIYKIKIEEITEIGPQGELTKEAP